MQTVYLFLLGFVLVAAVSDLWRYRIPNALIVQGLLCAITLHLFLDTGMSWQQVIWGMLTGLLVLLPFYLFRAMGAGDLKLMTMVGAFTGPMLMPDIVISTFIVGGVIAAVMLTGRLIVSSALAQRLDERLGTAIYTLEPQKKERLKKLPYGVAIALGTLIAVNHALVVPAV